MKLFLVFLLVSIASCGGKNSQKEVFRVYYPNGKLKSTTEMADNKKNGEELFFLENGQLLSRQTFKDNMLSDSLFQYDEFGKIVFKGLINRRSHADVYDYSGDKTGESDYKEEGVIDGLVLLYFANGKVSSFSIYKNGKRNGARVMYFTNGNVKEISHYKDGMEILPNIKFDSLGNLLR